jgi:hypothetical protein
MWRRNAAEGGGLPLRRRRRGFVDIDLHLQALNQRFKLAGLALA